MSLFIKVKAKYHQFEEMNRFLVLIHIGLMLICCNSPDQNPTFSSFKFNCNNSITSLDPAFASTQDNIWICSQLFDGLVQLDTGLNVQPAIAHSWSILDSGKRYRFYLRNDVHFQSFTANNEKSRQVTAHDFKYSFNRLVDPNTASSGAWMFNDIIDSIEPFKVVNDSVFEIHLNQPFLPFLSILTTPYAYVVPKEIVDKLGTDFGKNPIGTGPFKLKYWVANTKLILEKNHDYFESTKKTPIPKIDFVEISFIPDKQTAFLEFMQGKTDCFNGLESSFKDQLLNKDGHLKSQFEDQFYIHKSPRLNTEYLAFNMDSSNRYGAAFRTAVNLAIDKSSMLRHLRNNMGIPAEIGFVPDGLPIAARVKTNSFDPEMSRKLLRECGYTSSPFTLKIHTTPDYLDLTVYIQKALQDVGIDCKIDVMPSAFLRQEKRKGSLAFFRSSWIADYPDAESYLSCFLTKNEAPNGPNYSRFASQQYDILYQKAVREESDSMRLAYYGQMDQMIADSLPIIPLFYDETIRFYNKRISHMQHDALNSLLLKTVKKGL